MGLESGTFLDDLVITNPVGASDNVDKGDDHIRLIKTLLKNSFPDVDQAVSTVIFNAVEPALARKGTIWGDETLDLLKIRNKGDSAFITLAISMLTDNSVDVDAGTIDGATIGAASPSTGIFTTLSATDLSATNMDSTPIGQTTPAVAKVTSLEVTLTSLLTGKVDARETIDEAKGANIASAATTDIWTPATGNLVHITGTTNITGFGTAAKTGIERTLIFDGALTLIDGALLDCPGSENLGISAGDVVVVRADTTTIAKIVNHFPNIAINLLPRGHIDGLILSNNGADAVNDIDIAAGECRAENISSNMVRSAVLTKLIDAAWAVGSGAGGFPTGITLTNDTDYHVFLIKRTDTGVVDAGFDTSLTAVNLLADATNYNAYRRIGTVRRLTALNRLFRQDGDRITLDVSIEEKSGVFSTVGATLTIQTPTGVKCLALLTMGGTGTGVAGSQFGLLSPLNIANSAPSSSRFNAAGGGLDSSNEAHAANIEVMTDTSSGIRHRVTTNSNFLWKLHLHGYIDFRGMNS